MLTGNIVQGRWHEEVKEALPDGEIVYSSGTSDYNRSSPSACSQGDQGEVALIAKLADGRWLFFEWSYGSCSSCDAFENKTQQQMTKEIQQSASIMDAETMADFLVKCMATKANWLSKDYTAIHAKYTGIEPDKLLELVTKSI